MAYRNRKTYADRVRQMQATHSVQKRLPVGTKVRTTTGYEGEWIVIGHGDQRYFAGVRSYATEHKLRSLTTGDEITTYGLYAI